MMEADPLPAKVPEAEHTIDLSNNESQMVPTSNDQPRSILEKHDKRRDIQGLRTVAIVAVLLFHIWPKVFTNGYLGVDIFYVISGYLMAQILSKYPHLTLERIQHFYKRRVHRIVPIYLVIVYVTLHAGSYFLSSDDFEKMCSDGLAAITFTTNFQNMFKDDSYFAQVFTYRFFLHTWSLAVEMQFYLLVPLVFLILLSRHIRPRVTWVCVLVMAGSYILQLKSSEAVAFGLVFCRFWQFFAGILAYFAALERKVQEDEEEIDLFSIECEATEDKGLLEGKMTRVENEEKPSNVVITTSGEIALLITFCKLAHRLYPLLRILPWTLLICLVCALTMPFLESVKMEILQMFTIVSTACLLYLGSQQSNPTNNGLISMPYVLTNRLSVEIGDASYIWYLIHWPIIEFTIYWSTEGKLSLTDGLTVLAGSAVAAVVIDKIIDARLRSISSFKNVMTFIGVFFCFCTIFVIPPDMFGLADNSGQADTSGMTIDSPSTATTTATTDATTTSSQNEPSSTQNMNSTDASYALFNNASMESSNNGTEQ
ncbi:acyltransferase family domain-containing protein [Ditylenchus destructor]|uniref:Acyltransferase family domain-containing protein n=1 Tax=Ditylenchus destructor TaxID=166010 RepID=A0AAD4MPJ1_9BILA|nr:acyltransferase family domain-containing protein [Ditylenchus destructor]